MSVDRLRIEHENVQQESDFPVSFQMCTFSHGQTP